MDAQLSRRGLLIGTATAVAATHAITASPRAAADPFDLLRERWVDFLTGGQIAQPGPAITARIQALSELAQGWLTTAVEVTANSDIWPDLPMSATEANISGSYTRALDVATAWRTAGTAQFDDPAVAQTLVAWFRHLYTYWYNLTIAKTGNWWFWEIGIPRRLGDLAALIDPLLTDDDRTSAMAAVRRFTPNPNYRADTTSLAETGGNRADKALACILRGLSTRNADDLALARDCLSDVVGGGKASLFTFVTSGNGFYADGSYVDHTYLPYVGTYGNVALSGVARSLLILQGSDWAVTDPNLANILDAPIKAFAPFIWNGRMLEVVRGRAVSRSRESGLNNGLTTIASMLLLAPSLDPEHQQRYRSIARGWLDRADVDPTTVITSIGDLARIQRLLDDDSVAATAEPVGHQRTAAQERMVHRGKGWAFSVATSSSRIGRYEWGNNENHGGWHQGDGASYLYVEGNASHYSDDYWPTLDPYRLAGTTASLAERGLAAPATSTPTVRATNLWGGGVALAGRWGSAGMDLTNSLGNLSAKKGWFCLDDLIVVVNSGITARGAAAETIIDNRVIGDGVLLIDGQPVTGSTTSTPRWAHLSSRVGSTAVDVAGYLFVTAGQVTASVSSRTGTWRAVNSGADTGGTDLATTRRYGTLSLPHASGTSAGHAVHVILPRASAATTQQLASELEVRVLRADDAAQIVKVTRSGSTYLFAHAFTALTSGPVVTSGPVAVVARLTGTTAELAVSSPTRSLDAAQLSLDLGRPFARVVTADARLRVSGGRRIEVAADLASSGGASFEATVKVR